MIILSLFGQNVKRRSWIVRLFIFPVELVLTFLGLVEPGPRNSPYWRHVESIHDTSSERTEREKLEKQSKKFLKLNN